MAWETLWERLPANRAAFDTSDAMVGDGAAHCCPALCRATNGGRLRGGAVPRRETESFIGKRKRRREKRGQLVINFHVVFDNGA